MKSVGTALTSAQQFGNAGIPNIPGKMESGSNLEYSLQCVMLTNIFLSWSLINCPLCQKALLPNSLPSTILQKNFQTLSKTKCLIFHDFNFLKISDVEKYL